MTEAEVMLARATTAPTERSNPPHHQGQHLPAGDDDQIGGVAQDVDQVGLAEEPGLVEPEGQDQNQAGQQNGPRLHPAQAAQGPPPGRKRLFLGAGSGVHRLSFPHGAGSASGS